MFDTYCNNNNNISIQVLDEGESKFCGKPGAQKPRVVRASCTMICGSDGKTPVVTLTNFPFACQDAMDSPQTVVLPVGDMTCSATTLIPPVSSAQANKRMQSRLGSHLDVVNSWEIVCGLAGLQSEKVVPVFFRK